MQKLRLNFLFFLLHLCFVISAQNISPCRVKCNVKLRDSTFQNYHSELMYVQIDESAQEIRLFLDFSTFKTDHDSIDEWLHKIDKKVLKYKGSFHVESLTSSSNYEPKEVTSTGNLYINHIHHSCSIKFTLINVENSMHTNNASRNSINNIKISFKINIDPDKYKVNFKHHNLISPLTLNVSNADINKYVSGNENILNFHH